MERSQPSQIRLSGSLSAQGNTSQDRVPAPKAQERFTPPSPRPLHTAIHNRSAEVFSPQIPESALSPDSYQLIAAPAIDSQTLPVPESSNLDNYTAGANKVLQSGVVGTGVLRKHTLLTVIRTPEKGDIHTKIKAGFNRTDIGEEVHSSTLALDEPLTRLLESGNSRRLIFHFGGKNSSRLTSPPWIQQQLATPSPKDNNSPASPLETAEEQVSSLHTSMHDTLNKAMETSGTGKQLVQQLENNQTSASLIRDHIAELGRQNSDTHRQNQLAGNRARVLTIQTENLPPPEAEPVDDRSQERVLQLEQELISASQINNKLEQQNRQLQQELERHSQEVTELQQELEQHRHNQQELSEQREDYMRQGQEYRQQQSELNRKIGTLKLQREQDQNRINDLQNRLQQADLGNNELQEEIRQIKLIESQHQTSLTTLNRELNLAQSQLSSLEEKLSLAQKAIAARQDQLTQAQDRVDVQKAALEKKSEQLASTHEQLRNSEKTRAGLAESISQLEKQIHGYESLLEEKGQALQALHASNESMARHTDQIQHKLVSAKEELTACKQDMDQRLQENQLMIQQVNVLHQKLKNIETDYLAQQQRLEEFEKRDQQLIETIQQETRKMQNSPEFPSNADLQCTVNTLLPFVVKTSQQHSRELDAHADTKNQLHDEQARAATFENRLQEQERLNRDSQSQLIEANKNLQQLYQLNKQLTSELEQIKKQSETQKVQHQQEVDDLRNQVNLFRQDSTQTSYRINELLQKQEQLETQDQQLQQTNQELEKKLNERDKTIQQQQKDNMELQNKLQKMAQEAIKSQRSENELKACLADCTTKLNLAGIHLQEQSDLLVETAHKLDTRESEALAAAMTQLEQNQEMKRLQQEITRLQGINQSNSQLQLELLKSEDERRKIEAVLESTKGTMNELSEGLTKSNQIQQTLHSIITDNENKLLSLQKEKSNLIKQNETLKKEKVRSVGEKSKLESKIKALEELEQANNEGNKALKKELEDQKQLASKQIEYLKTLEQNLKSQAQQIEANAVEREQANNKLAKLAEELKATLVVMETQTQDKTQLETDLAQAKASLLEMQNNAQKQAHELQKLAHEQEKELSKLRQNHQVLTSILSTANQEKNQTQQEADQHKDIAKKLKLENQTLTETVRKMEHTLLAKDEENKGLSSRLTQAENHVERLKYRSDQLEKSTKEIISDWKKNQSELLTLMDSAAKANHQDHFPQASDLQSELREAEADPQSISASTVDGTVLRHKLERLLKDQEQLQFQQREYEEAIRKQQEENAQLATELDQQTAQNKQLEEKLQEQEIQNQNLKRQENSSNASHRAQLNINKTKISQLNTNLSKLERENRELKQTIEGYKANMQKWTATLENNLQTEKQLDKIVDSVVNDKSDEESANRIKAIPRQQVNEMLDKRDQQLEKTKAEYQSQMEGSEQMYQTSLVKNSELKQELQRKQQTVEQLAALLNMHSEHITNLKQALEQSKQDSTAGAEALATIFEDSHWTSTRDALIKQGELSEQFQKKTLTTDSLSAELVKISLISPRPSRSPSNSHEREMPFSSPQRDGKGISMVNSDSNENYDPNDNGNNSGVESGQNTPQLQTGLFTQSLPSTPKIDEPNMLLSLSVFNQKRSSDH